MIRTATGQQMIRRMNHKQSAIKVFIGWKQIKLPANPKNRDFAPEAPLIQQRYPVLYNSVFNSVQPSTGT